MAAAARPALFLLLAQPARACLCPPSNMSGVWGGMKLVFTGQNWSEAAQAGSISADPSGSEYAALGSGVGEWSGGYHYFRASLNFSNAPGISYSGQLDCTCDNLIVSSRHAPGGLPKTLNLMLGTSRGPLNWTGPALPPPDWVANLSIYEINPRAPPAPSPPPPPTPR